MKRRPNAGQSSSPRATKSSPRDSQLAELKKWKRRLVNRKYLSQLDPLAAQHYSARIESSGTRWYFPLGTDNVDRAAKRALQIDRLVRSKGWDAALKCYQREFTLAIFWADNPLLCTYTTLLTSPRETNRTQPLPTAVPPGPGRIAFLERDDEVRRALALWAGESCGGTYSDPAEARQQVMSDNTNLFFANRSLADLRPEAAPDNSPTPDAAIPTISFGIYETSDDIFIAHSGVRNGYFLRRTSPSNLLDPIKGAWDEGRPTAQQALLHARRYFQYLAGTAPTGDDSSERSDLTPREEEILLRLSKGFPDKQIAAALSISTWTVHNHMKNIFRKLDVHTRTQAVIRYLQR